MLGGDSQPPNMKLASLIVREVFFKRRSLEQTHPLLPLQSGRCCHMLDFPRKIRGESGFDQSYAGLCSELDFYLQELMRLGRRAAAPTHQQLRGCEIVARPDELRDQFVQLDERRRWDRRWRQENRLSNRRNRPGLHTTVAAADSCGGISNLPAKTAVAKPLILSAIQRGRRRHVVCPTIKLLLLDYPFQGILPSREGTRRTVHSLSRTAFLPITPWMGYPLKGERNVSNTSCSRKDSKPCSQFTINLPANFASTSRPVSWGWVWCDCSKMLD